MVVQFSWGTQDYWSGEVNSTLWYYHDLWKNVWSLLLPSKVDPLADPMFIVFTVNSQQWHCPLPTSTWEYCWMTSSTNKAWIKPSLHKSKKKLLTFGFWVQSVYSECGVKLTVTTQTKREERINLTCLQDSWQLIWYGQKY